MTYQEERNLFLDKFMQFYFYDMWKGKRQSVYKATLELFFPDTCNLRCNYCYLKNFGKDLYPCPTSKDTILKNLKLFLQFLLRNNMYPPLFELFGGEIFSLSYYDEILDLLYYFIKESIDLGEATRSVVVPTNSTFLADDKKTENIFNWYVKFKDLGGGIFYSHSVDGFYLDKQTRPFRATNRYDESFYKKMFVFAKEVGSAFHPMVGAVGIENWKDNFDWYIQNITDHLTHNEATSLRRLYLLEVRNPDWSMDQLVHLYDFMKYIIHRAFEIHGFDRAFFMDQFLRKKALNILSMLTSSVGRGIGCSEQQQVYIRLGDLAVVSCHRTSYAGYEAGKYVVENGKIDRLEAINPEFFVLFKTFESDSCPRCADCNINTLCDKFCLGANYEINKDFFTPVPSVCRMQFVKASAMLMGLEEIGMLKTVINQNMLWGRKQKKKATQMTMLRDYLLKEEFLNAV